jgi:hypothetical protein
MYDFMSNLEPILRSRVTTPALQKFTTPRVNYFVLKTKSFSTNLKNAQVYYNAGVVVVNYEVVASAPGIGKSSIQLLRPTALFTRILLHCLFKRIHWNHEFRVTTLGGFSPNGLFFDSGSF